MQNRWIILGAAVALAAPIAWAGLSSPRSAPAVAASHAPLPSAAHVVSRSLPDNVQIRASKGPEGIPVQEYISADGSLFAITWAGPQRVQPQAVVDHYFPQAAHGTTQVVHGTRIVVRSASPSWGNEGVAYRPAVMPLDFDPDGLAP